MILQKGSLPDISDLHELLCFSEETERKAKQRKQNKQKHRNRSDSSSSASESSDTETNSDEADDKDEVRPIKKKNQVRTKRSSLYAKAGCTRILSNELLPWRTR